MEHLRMTNTERIAHSVYNRHMQDLHIEVVNLGILASQCELMAASEQSVVEKGYLLLKADEYRQQQAILMLEREEKVQLPYVHSDLLHDHVEKMTTDDGNLGPLLAMLTLGGFLTLAGWFIWHWLR